MLHITIIKLPHTSMVDILVNALRPLATDVQSMLF